MSADLVFCLPHAGGGSHQYLSWTATLDEVFTWVPLEYPGHFTRDEEPCYGSFTDAVAGLVEEIEKQAVGRRIGLFGHSMGGSLAYEVGRLLSARRRVVLDALVISSAEPPSASPAARQRYFELGDEELLEHLENLGGVRSSLLARSFLAETLPLIRSDYRLHHSYRPDADASIDVPLHVCYGSDEAMTKQRVPAWRRHASAPVTFHRFDGGHFYWQSNPMPLTGTLREIFGRGPEPSDGTEMRGPSCPR
ncbi:alpha/beta fold hydrolase [Streptomyces sp. NPDC051104]|uniref:thioesterase II family protein n=1 Tax=Streptomyces sp. NPDC051104 TaxID=3155044 RepID=UPI00341D7965